MEASRGADVRRALLGWCHLMPTQAVRRPGTCGVSAKSAANSTGPQLDQQQEVRRRRATEELSAMVLLDLLDSAPALHSPKPMLVCAH